MKLNVSFEVLVCARVFWRTVEAYVCFLVVDHMLPRELSFFTSRGGAGGNGGIE